MMLTSEFECNGALVRVKLANKKLDAFDAAIYTRKLYQIYGDMQNDLGAAYTVVESKDGQGKDQVNIAPNPEAFMRPDIQAGMTVYNSIRDFAAVAPRITELHGDEVEWVGPRSTPEKIDTAFRFWLADEDLQMAIQEHCERLDFPNGKEGAPAALLTKDELSDPNSLSADTNTPSK
jgi:hypothetical protein